MAFCVGCDKKHTEFSEYNEDNPVEADGTYHKFKFICNECYMHLIQRGLDMGGAEELQQRVKALKEFNEFIKNVKPQNLNRLKKVIE